MRNAREVILMLRAVSGDERYLEMMDKIKEAGGQTMCDLLDEYWNKGVQAGEKRGITQGISQGISQGVSRAISNLMNTMKLTLEQAMDALLVPDEEREMYAKMIGVESE